MSLLTIGTCTEQPGSVSRGRHHMSLLTIGTCTEQPGSVSRGRVDLFEQPLDPEDRTLALSVVILSGKQPGPTVLVTANIHGDEVCPTIVAHRVIEHIESRLDQLCGRVVVFPTLNPTGHLNNTRFPQFEAQDPNRFWPDANPDAASNRAKAAREQGDWLGEFTYLTSEPKPIERCWNAVFELFRACKPDFHVDLHTICHLSIPFQFLDRVLYSENADGSNRLAAEDLFQRTRAMCEAIGITIVLENSPKVYTKKDLHRSTSGAVLNVLLVPSVTFELGGNSIAEPGARDAGVQGIRNLLVHAGSLPGTIEPITSAPAVLNSTLHRHINYPFAPCAGVVDFLKRAGERFQRGDALAVMRTVDGRIKCTIQADFDGFVVVWRQGVTKFGGEALGVCGAEDRMPTVASWESLK